MTEPEVTTLIEKACGHYGMIRQRHLQTSIACSQCEAANARNAIVDIMRQLVLPSSDVPEHEPRAMDTWIRKQLEAGRATE